MEGKDFSGSFEIALRVFGAWPVRLIPQTVALGLDPRVHAAFRFPVDARVKPEHDNP